LAVLPSARDMRQKPVYVLNHSQHNFRQRTTQADLDEIEDWTDRASRRMYEGAGLGPEDVDIFNPYDGYAMNRGLRENKKEFASASLMIRIFRAEAANQWWYAAVSV
jgi:hypothetical protein